MVEQIKFHLDENVNNAIADGLRRRGIDVTISVQVNLISASDYEQLTFAHSQGRVIFTQDRERFFRTKLFRVRAFWDCLLY